MTDLLAGIATAGTLIYLGRRLYGFLDAHWQVDATPGELPESRPAVRIVRGVVDWDERQWY